MIAMLVTTSVVVVALGVSWFFADSERHYVNFVEQWKALIRKGEERGTDEAELESRRIGLAGVERTLRVCRAIGAPWKLIARAIEGRQ